MTDCLFCSIVAGEVPSQMVYEDESSLAFLDIQPINRGHTLVIPKEHATGLSDLPPAAAAHMMQVAQKIGAALRAADLQCEGVNLLLADGEAAGQEVPHVHLHVVPRAYGDGFGYSFPADYAQKPEQDELAQIAASLRAQVGSP